MRNAMIKTLKNISLTAGGNPIEGQEFTVVSEVANNYGTSDLPTIQAGKTILADFAGDFGMYGIVEVDGRLHKVKIDIKDLHLVCFGKFDARSIWNQ